METLSTSHGLVVTRTYEPQRDVLGQITNQFDEDVISHYDYRSDELRRRTSMITGGQAFDSLPQPVIPEESTTYMTNTLNQYTSIQYPASSIQLTYDLDGNLTNDGTFEYTYDAENRLTSVTPLNPQNGDKKTECAYDYMIRRM